MSTDHTSGSSLDASTAPVSGAGFVTPSFDDARRDGSDPFNGGQGDAQPGGDVITSPPQQVRESAPDFVMSNASETDAIEFRVIRPGAPVRRLRLTGNRYTFGSAEGCSIRLNDHAPATDARGADS